MHITVVNYRPQWKSDFQHEADVLRRLLGDTLIAVFHIGSTAVPGLRAKPIIDILPVVEDLAALDARADGFAALGYEVMGEYGITGRRYYRKGGERRTHQIHAFGFNNIAEIERHLALRDYLRAHPAVCDAYGELKSRLARQFPQDIDGYSDGKHDFVRAAEADALRWHYRQR